MKHQKNQTILTFFNGPSPWARPPSQNPLTSRIVLLTTCHFCGVSLQVIFGAQVHVCMVLCSASTSNLSNYNLSGLDKRNLSSTCPKKHKCRTLPFLFLFYFIIINQRDLEAPALQESPPTHAHVEETPKLVLDLAESPPKDALTLKLDMLAGILHSYDCAARLTPLIFTSGDYQIAAFAAILWQPAPCWLYLEPRGGQGVRREWMCKQRRTVGRPDENYVFVQGLHTRGSGGIDVTPLLTLLNLSLQNKNTVGNVNSARSLKTLVHLTFPGQHIFLTGGQQLITWITSFLTLPSSAEGVTMSFPVEQRVQ